MSLHERIKEARLRRGITQEQLGALIGVAKTTITGYEKNREPTAAKVGEIADALGVDVNFLFQDEVKALHENRAKAGLRPAPPSSPSRTCGQSITSPTTISWHLLAAGNTFSRISPPI